MAQEFKKYDKLYASYRGQFFAFEDRRAIEKHAEQLRGWPYKVFSWSGEEIQIAVYSTAESAGWQKFRVSMRGQSSQLKLARLHNWLKHDTSEMNRCRVDNYINAMKRGGLLDSKLQILPTPIRAVIQERANAL